jgi:hypothetical protein
MAHDNIPFIIARKIFEGNEAFKTKEPDYSQAKK